MQVSSSPWDIIITLTLPLPPQHPAPCRRETVISISPLVFQMSNWGKLILWLEGFTDGLRSWGRYGGEERDFHNCPSRKRRPCEDRESAERDGGIQDEIQKEVILHITEVKRILDPAQQRRFFDLMRQSMTHEQSPWLPTKGGK